MRIVWFKKASAAILVLALPILLQAQSTDQSHNIKVEWRQIGALPDGSRDAVGQHFPGLAGSFMGVHDGALIFAGGLRMASSPGLRTADDYLNATYHDRIWVATRNNGADQNGDGDTAADERQLTWHDTQLRLMGNRARGVSASHRLGLIAIGGTDGQAGHSDGFLIRWNGRTERASLLRLPPMPSVSVDGGAAIIDDTLYVMAGNNGVGPTSDLFSFDLSRVETDDAGNPLADGDKVRIIEKQNDQGSTVNPWQKLPAMPQSEGENLKRSHTTVVIQNDRSGDRLYVIGGRRASSSAEDTNGIHEYSDVWAYNPGVKDSNGAWARMADIRVDGQTVKSSAAAGVALGQTHILLLAGPGENAERMVLSYNTITDAWAEYSEAPLATETKRAAGNRVNAINAASDTAVRWADDIVLVHSNSTPGEQSPKIWAVNVLGTAENFGWPNMAVLITYLLAMLMIGVYFSFKNKDTDDYFRGGQQIPWWAAACSIYSTMLSSLTYVALPALIYRTDWLIFFGSATIIIVTPFIIRVVLPFFRQIDATSAYEYLSKRFNMPVRLFASGLFALFHISRIGIVLALTALALAAVTPLETWQSVLVMGVLSLMYCTLGGIEAVIWTDTVQTVVLLMGAVLCVAFILGGVDGGFFGIVESGMAKNKFRMVNLDFGPKSITTLSIWVIVLGGIGQSFSSLTADQAVVQRYMTTKSTRDAAKSIWANAVLTVPSLVLFFFIGTGLYGFYVSHPEKLDPTMQIDQIFPAFIVAELPIGIAGLIIAGIFSAAQSTISTSMNSIATTLVTDFMRPFNVCRSERGYLNAARLMTFLVGILGTFTGLLFISPEIRSLMEEYFKIIGMFMGALAGLFVLGFMTSRANGRGAFVGIFTGVGVMVVVWRMQWADGYLFATIGTVCCLAAGYLASLILPADHHDLNGLTIYNMHRDGVD